LLWSLTEVLPSGIYDSLALEGYTRYVLSGNGRTNRFEQLARDLYIIATDLDNGKRVVFGRNYRTDVSISLAVAASSALPLVYKPVRIGEHEYVDGGLRGTASLDLAIEHGATLVICINPLVPYDNSDLDSIPFLGADGGHLSQKGMQSIASQVSRISTHSGLHYHLKQLRRSHPEVDIILIEPHPDDYQMFFYNIMRYSARLTIAEHGFESVTLGLTEDYSHYKEILARHAIPITRRLVSEELTEIQDANYDPTVVRRVLESRSASYGRSNRDTPVGQLTRSLAELELAIDRMMMQAAGPPDAEPAAPEPA
jgi:hypothetical protein